MGKNTKKVVDDDDSSEEQKVAAKGSKKVIKMNRRIDKGTKANKKKPTKATGAKNAKKGVASKVAKSKQVGKGAKKATAGRNQKASKGRGKDNDDSSDSGSDDENKPQARKLPGQRYPTPDEEDGAIIFYQTLYKQSPGNKFAQKWLLEHGLLPIEEVKKIMKSN